MTHPARFDSYAEGYDSALNRALAASGEEKDFYARGRVQFLAESLERVGERPGRMMDYACGIGSTTPLFLGLLGVSHVIGLDVSSRALEVATRTYGSTRATFLRPDEYRPAGDLDLVYCNGAFHHIPVMERGAVVAYMARVLRPGGVLALWENNPFNPGTRFIMSRCEFDADAVLASPAGLRRLLVKSGFRIERTDFLFVFPRLLGWLRPLEKALSRLPFGGQYQVLARRTRRECS